MSACYRVTFKAATNADLRQGFQVTDDDGAPIDLTGADLRMDVEERPGVDVLEASSANGMIAVTAPATGHFELAVPAAVMGGLAPGVYQHDLVATLANGHVHRIWAGTLTLARGVSE